MKLAKVKTGKPLTAEQSAWIFQQKKTAKKKGIGRSDQPIKRLQ